MAVITSSDNIASATVNIIQDSDGVYAVQVTALSPNLTEFAVEVGGHRVWQDQARTDDQGGD